MDPNSLPAANENDPLTPGKQERCQNCDTPLQGDWCHACGQPVRGMIRRFDAILMDAIDTLLIYDKRIWRTLIPLYFRPARITNDFIAGRQARYVPPFRLFFVLSLVTFLTLQFLVDPQETFNLNEAANQAPARDTTPAEADPSGTDGPGATVTVESAGQAPTSAAETNAPVRFDLSSLREDEWTIQIGWLPQIVNAQLNAWLQQALANVERAGEDPGRLVDSMFNLLPVALFVLMPVFALLLKILFLFNHRLYMEHLVVALHSHAFLFMAILVCVFLSLLAGATASITLLSRSFDLLFEIAQLWIPVYLFLMQKYCYRQGWFMTSAKFLLLGTLYTAMIILVVVAAVFISLITF